MFGEIFFFLNGSNVTVAYLYVRRIIVTLLLFAVAMLPNIAYGDDRADSFGVTRSAYSSPALDSQGVELTRSF